MGAAILLVLLVVGIVIVVVGADRYRPQRKSPYTLPTHEVFVDPVTKSRQRVHVDPATGERVYVDEPAPLPGSPVPPLARPGLLGTPDVQYPPGALPPGGGYIAVPPQPTQPAIAPPAGDQRPG